MNVTHIPKHYSFNRRLLQGMRDDTNEAGGSLNKIGDVSFRQDESEFQDNIREASGIGKVKRKVSRLVAVARSQLTLRSYLATRS